MKKCISLCVAAFAAGIGYSATVDLAQTGDLALAALDNAAEYVNSGAERRTLTTEIKGDEVKITFLKELNFGKLADVKSARPVMVLAETPPKGMRLVDADGKDVPRAVVNDRFVLVPVSGRHAAGETLRYRIAR